jgi:hypothetical protein
MRLWELMNKREFLKSICGITIFPHILCGQTKKPRIYYAKHKAILTTPQYGKLETISLIATMTTPFAVFGSIKSKEQSDPFQKIKIFKTLGKIKDIKIYAEHHYLNIYDYSSRYLQYPIETIVELIGEHGKLEYSTFNMKILDKQELHLNPWDFINKIEENADDECIELKYTSELKYKNNKFRLCSVEFFNKVKYDE